jgi:hypothetical protein
MTEKEFLKLFKVHAKKMREVKSYREMISNLKHPEKLSGDHCPFGGKTRNEYWVINNENEVELYDSCIPTRVDSLYIEAVYFWVVHRSDELIFKMIPIIRELMKK